MAHESSNDLNTPMILVIGLVSAVATFSIILLLIAMYHTVRVSQEEEAVAVEYADPKALLNRQRQGLNDRAMIDAGTGQVRLNIDEAMTLVLADLESGRGNDGVRDSRFLESTKVVSGDASATDESAAEDRQEDAAGDSGGARGENAADTGGNDGQTDASRGDAALGGN